MDAEARRVWDGESPAVRVRFRGLTMSVGEVD